MLHNKQIVVTTYYIQAAMHTSSWLFWVHELYHWNHVYKYNIEQVASNWKLAALKVVWKWYAREAYLQCNKNRGGGFN